MKQRRVKFLIELRDGTEFYSVECWPNSTMETEALNKVIRRREKLLEETVQKDVKVYRTETIRSEVPAAAIEEQIEWDREFPGEIPLDYYEDRGYNVKIAKFRISEDVHGNGGVFYYGTTDSGEKAGSSGPIRSNPERAREDVSHYIDELN